MLTSFVRVYLLWWSKIENTVFNVTFLIYVDVCQKVKFTTEV